MPSSVSPPRSNPLAMYSHKPHLLQYHRSYHALIDEAAEDYLVCLIEHVFLLSDDGLWKMHETPLSYPSDPHHLQQQKPLASMNRSYLPIYNLLSCLQSPNRESLLRQQQQMHSSRAEYICLLWAGQLL